MMLVADIIHLERSQLVYLTLLPPLLGIRTYVDYFS